LEPAPVIVHRVHDHSAQPVSKGPRRIVDEILHGLDELDQDDLSQLVVGLWPKSQGPATGPDDALIALGECSPRPLIPGIADGAEQAGPCLRLEGTSHETTSDGPSSEMYARGEMLALISVNSNLMWSKKQGQIFLRED